MNAIDEDHGCRTAQHRADRLARWLRRSGKTLVASAAAVGSALGNGLRIVGTPPAAVGLTSRRIDRCRRQRTSIATMMIKRILAGLTSNQ